jgi:hypothetical protein
VCAILDLGVCQAEELCELFLSLLIDRLHWLSPHDLEAILLEGLDARAWARDGQVRGKGRAAEACTLGRTKVHHVGSVATGHAAIARGATHAHHARIGGELSHLWHASHEHVSHWLLLQVRTVLLTWDVCRKLTPNADASRLSLVSDSHLLHVLHDLIQLGNRVQLLLLRLLRRRLLELLLLHGWSLLLEECLG